jgi:2-dehydro-3-deoxyphosphogluconate aldolase/(4S)-4-hydroxy-2-oxoglutarate aldolase
MTLDPVSEALIAGGVVAVLRAPSADAFAAVAEVLVDAGVTGIELTLTSHGAVDALTELRGRLGDAAVLGAGTIITADQATAAVDAGARFLVSPAYDPVLLATDFGVPFYPGGLTPSEILAASRVAPLVKLFPASAVGPGYIKDLHGPLPDVKIMPTGGIAIDDIAGWLGAGASVVGLGGPLIGDATSGGRLADLADRARRAVGAVAAARS